MGDRMIDASAPQQRPSPYAELQDVSITFAGVKRLKQVHLAVGRGQITTVMGPSGSGKSLVLKLIAGLLQPTEGVVWVEGRKFSNFTRDEITKRSARVGMLFQRNALFDSMTAIENVKFPQIETQGVTNEAAEMRARELLESVGLSNAAERYPGEMSGGMQKRLGIARALALKPEFVLYDDPTAGLDPITSRSIMRLIKDLQLKSGATAVVVTNEVARAFQVADQMAFTFGGELVAAGPPEQARSHADPRIQQFLKGGLIGPLTSSGPSDSESL